MSCAYIEDHDRIRRAHLQDVTGVLQEEQGSRTTKDDEEPDPMGQHKPNLVARMFCSFAGDYVVQKPIVVDVANLCKSPYLV